MLMFCLCSTVPAGQPLCLFAQQDSVYAEVNFQTTTAGELRDFSGLIPAFPNKSGKTSSASSFAFESCKPSKKKP